MVYDIAIIGGGPSGSTLAYLLAEKFKVLLIEKRPFSEKIYGKEKCCGGLLAPDAQKMIAKLGLGLPKDILTGPQLFSVRAIDFDSGLTRNYQRHYINMDREKFDSWLVNRIPESVDIRFGASLKSIEKTKDGSVLKVLIDGTEFTFETSVVVGSDGADSRVRKVLYGDRCKIKSYTAVQEWFRMEDALAPSFYSIFDSEITDFYSWIILKDQYLILGSAIKDNVVSGFDLLKEKLKVYGINPGKPVKKNGTRLLRPGYFNSFYPGDGNIALTGEAAGLISPSSAEGLSYAMESAMILAQSIKNDRDFTEGYHRRLRTVRRKLLMKNMKSIVMYNRTLRKLVMYSGVLTIR